MVNIIEVKNLTRKFNGLTAVDDISFEVKKGEIFGFLGPNGAGKSTTINMLSTIIAPTNGNALVNGFSIIGDKDEVRKSIGLVFQDPSLDDRLTADENLCFHARLYGVPKDEYNKRIEEVLKLVELWDRKDDIVKTFSGGMKRRLEIARGLIHYPAVLFLDEPTLGLDPQTRVHIWDYIMKLKREREMTIFMTTHYMNEAEYCDRIGIIDNGKIVALDTPANLKKMVGGDIISLTSQDKQTLKKELEEKYGKEVKEEDDILKIEVVEGEKFMPRLFNELQTKIDSISLKKPALDDVFLFLTGRKIREEEASSKDFMRNFMRMRGR
ncbi:MAG: ATP-binding cassette domain-containing protein [Candidatus Portnoybacteria bacterium]|nr:ATP-binding cassette domain-containing protein [Candidatus Portnoybacteria bacterium]